MNLKRYLIVIIVFLFSTAFLCACQPTPGQQPVVNKGNLEQTIIDKTTQTPQPVQTEQAEASASGGAGTARPAVVWKEEYVDKKGIFKVKIDAEVIEPGATVFPAARMALSRFSDELLSKAVKTFFDDGPIYDGNIAPTKSELAEAIVKLKAEQNDPNVKIDENYLKFLEDACNDAPEDVELKQIEPVWKDNQVNIMQQKDGGGRAGIYGISSDKEKCFIEYEHGQGHYLPAGTLNGIPNGVSITPDEAERKAMSIAGQLGLENYMIVSKAAGGLIDTDPENIDPMHPSKEQQCYIFYLSQVIDGIPFTYVRKAEGEFMTDERPYAPPVDQETIEIHISDKGVIYFRWDNPYEQTGYVSDNVEILDLEEIKSIFLAQMKRVGEGRNERYSANGKTDDTISIKRVEQGMMVTIDKDKPGRFLGIPVWDFFASNSEMGEETDYSILTINAIDGSIINRNLGY